MSLDVIRTIGILGAGTMGNGIAHVFARSGYEVILRDIEPRYLDRAMDTIGNNLDREVKKGKIAAAAKSGALGRIHVTTELSEIQYLVHFRDCIGRLHQQAGTLHRHAFHEPGPGDGAGRDHPRPANWRRHI